MTDKKPGLYKIYPNIVKGKPILTKDQQFNEADLSYAKFAIPLLHEIRIVAGGIKQAGKAEAELKNYLDKRISTPQQESEIKVWASKISKAMQKFVLEKYNIDLGNFDVVTGFEYIVIKNEGKMMGRNYLQGKIANNYFLLDDDLPLTYDKNNRESLGQFIAKFIHILVHEILHKMFNLDNRLDLDYGMNTNSLNIGYEFRESLVEYFAGIITHGISKDLVNATLPIETLWKTTSYDQFINKYIAKFVVNAGEKLANQVLNSNPTKNKDKVLKYSHNLINSALADFLFSGSNEIDKISKELKIPSLLSIIR